MLRGATLFDGMTAGPAGVSGQSWRTGTLGLVVYDVAHGVAATRGRAGGAGVGTLIVDTGQVGGTTG